ncbi:MAG: hypothetical protein PHR68_03825 [Candidatus Gracilibacteria bacterium]|nr:hypothetical protein [Candidatus Gracilibacteria bacterium]
MSKSELICTNFVESIIEEDYTKYEKTLKKFDLKTLKLELESIIGNPYLEKSEVIAKIRLIRKIQKEKVLDIINKKYNF